MFVPRRRRRDEKRHAIECGSQATLHTSSREEHWNKLTAKLSTLERDPSHTAQSHILPTSSTTPKNENNNLSQPTSRVRLTLLSGAFTRPRRVSPSKCFSTHPPFLHIAIGFVAHRLSLTPAPFPGASPLLSKRHVRSRRVMTPRSQTSVLSFPDFGRLSSIYSASRPSSPFGTGPFSEHPSRKLAHSDILWAPCRYHKAGLSSFFLTDTFASHPTDPHLEV